MTRKLVMGLVFLLFTSSIESQIVDKEKWRLHPELLIKKEREMAQRLFYLRTKAKEVDQSAFDVVYYQLNLNIVPDSEFIHGDVYLRAKSTVPELSEVILNLSDTLTVDSIKLEDLHLTFTHSADLLTIELDRTYATGEEFSFSIFYRGYPEATGFGSFTFRMHNGVPIISSLSEPFGARSWWPCKDNPADKADSVDINVTVPQNLIVASNGVLLDVVDNLNGTKTYKWHESYPITTYLVSVAITNYETFSDYYHYSPTDSMEVQYYVYPEDYAKAVEDFNVTVDMIEYYSSTFGQYPFIREKYGMAEFPWGGAMEHQTCTSYGSRLITGNHTYDWIIAHELAHQWWGNMITMRSWPHIWLNEGFASYSEALYWEYKYGEDAYHEYMDDFDRLGYFEGSVYVEDSTNEWALFSRTVYDKGAWVLHMLRHVMGDSAFFQALRKYAADTNLAYGNATTEDFRVICESVYGNDLSWFFSEWVYGTGRPKYYYDWSYSYEAGTYTVNLRITQMQTNIFKMPLDITIYAGATDTTFVVWDSLISQDFTFYLSEAPESIKIDKDNWVLKKLQLARVYTIAGMVEDAATGYGVPNAYIYWAGPIDPQAGIADTFGIDSTDAEGNYHISLITGLYQFSAYKEGYLSTSSIFIELNQDTVIDFSLTSPILSINIDSISIDLTEGELYIDTIRIENVGSGKLLYSLTEVSSYNRSRKGVILPHYTYGLKSLVHNFNFNGQPTANREHKNLPPVDTLWRLVCEDPMDNMDGTLDIDKTYLQINDGNFSFKVVTHKIFGQLKDLYYLLFLDTDHDNSTGAPMYELGIDYMILVSYFAPGMYAILYNMVTGDWFLPSYYDIAPNSDYFVFSFLLSEMQNPTKLDMFSLIYNPNNLLFDRDWAPDEGQGHFSFSTEDVAWISESQFFGIVPSDSTHKLIITIDPVGLDSGVYHYYLVIDYNQPVDTNYLAEPKVIPITLNYTGVEEISTHPSIYTLSDNFPNPFSGTTKIRYGIPKPTKVRLAIYNIVGQKIVTLINADKEPGYYEICWNGKDEQGNIANNGIYFYRLVLQPIGEAAEYVKTKKAILLR